jgi:hypothetical protein
MSGSSSILTVRDRHESIASARNARVDVGQSGERISLSIYLIELCYPTRSRYQIHTRNGKERCTDWRNSTYRMRDSTASDLRNIIIT